jgi:truncated hemoglobin YjbI
MQVTNPGEPFLQFSRKVRYMNRESASSTMVTAAMDAQSQSLYELLGGADACHRLVTAFYARVPQDPVLRAVYYRSNRSVASPSGISNRCAIESLTYFLEQFLGGPCTYSQHRWTLSLREAHGRFKIGPEARDAWLRTMSQVLDDAGIEEAARNTLRQFFAQASAFLINHPAALLEATGDAVGAVGEGKREEKPACPFHQEIMQRWEAHVYLEEIIAAVQSDDAPLAIEIAESESVQAYFKQDRGAFLSLLGIMSGSRDSALVEYVRDTVSRQSELIRERYSGGRTLLHDAATAGNVAIVEELMRLGADPNAVDDAGHAPLYYVGNGCALESGREVVHALARAGANVNVQGGIKRCTALHMAARRGTVPVAEGLLDCGADIEVRDSLGETPLRRAVNCGKSEMVALLLSRGADAHSRGSKGLTPCQVARGAAMKRLLEPYAGLA